jgi:SAM-dependent methyltransferase
MMAETVIANVKKAIAHRGLAFNQVSYPLQMAVWRLIETVRSYAFDATLNVKTRGRINHEQLVEGATEIFEHATWYEPCPIDYLDKTVGYFLAHFEPAKHFVDVGCGEGRACFYTMRMFPRVTGVELSLPLVQAARENLKSCKNRHGCEIRFLQADASTFHLPDEKCLIFLYNPFNELVFNKFIDSNLDHFHRHASCLIYLGKSCGELLVSRGFEKRYARRSHPASGIYMSGTNVR